MRMFVSGTWVDRDEKIEVRDPQDGALIDTVPSASLEDIDLLLASAEDGRRIARQMPAHQRMDILNDAAARIDAAHEEFARTIALEGIKTIREARKEVSRAVTTLKISAEEARRLTGETIRFDQVAASERRLGYFTREPVGIIAAITPYNDPLNLVAHKVGPAIAAGNAVVVKPDSRTPLSALMLARALQEAGVPSGVVQVITGQGREVGNALVRDPRVRMVSFTGGAAVGAEIMRHVGIKRVALELGSNCPVIVMPDADLDLAVTANVSGAYWAAGQNCLHVQRLFVHEKIFDEFSSRFVQGARSYTVGPKLNEETDMGPLINERHAENVERLVAEAVAAGARLLTGGERSGNFFSPTVLENLPASCSLAREEIYGPVTVLYRFSSLDDAIAQANNVDYGLQAAIFTRDLEIAHRAIAGLDVGGVMVNDSTDYRIDAMPFGGVKGSGLGREGVRSAVLEMTEPKVVCFNLTGGI